MSVEWIPENWLTTLDATTRSKAEQLHWAVAELNDEFELTGRCIDGFHEGILSADPSGKESKVS